MGGALYLLFVPAHYALDEAEAEETIGRWLDTLQARAPGAVVQIVVSHVDRLVEGFAEAMGHMDSSPGGKGGKGGKGAPLPTQSPIFRKVLKQKAKEMLTPLALAAAAIRQVEWVREKVGEHARRHAEAVAGHGWLASPPPPLRVQEEILLVSAVSGGEATLKELRDHLAALTRAQPPLLPSAGYVIPRSYVPALAAVLALRDGRDALRAARKALAAAPQGFDTPQESARRMKSLSQEFGAPQESARRRNSVRPPPPGAAVDDNDEEELINGRPYVLLSELGMLWGAEIGPRLLPDEPADRLSTTLHQALELLANQGELFLSNGVRAPSLPHACPCCPCACTCVPLTPRPARVHPPF